MTVTRTSIVPTSCGGVRTDCSYLFSIVTSGLGRFQFPAYLCLLMSSLRVRRGGSKSWCGSSSWNKQSYLYIYIYIYSFGYCPSFTCVSHLGRWAALCRKIDFCRINKLAKKLVSIRAISFPRPPYRGSWECSHLPPWSNHSQPLLMGVALLLAINLHR